MHISVRAIRKTVRVSHDPVLRVVFVDAPSDDEGGMVGHDVLLIDQQRLIILVSLEDTTSIYSKVRWRIPVSQDSSVFEDLLLDALLGRVCEVISLLDLGDGGTFLIILARMTIRRHLEWSASFTRDGRVLSEETVENGPPTHATFIKIAAR